MRWGSALFNINNCLFCAFLLWEIITKREQVFVMGNACCGGDNGDAEPIQDETPSCDERAPLLPKHDTAPIAAQNNTSHEEPNRPFSQLHQEYQTALFTTSSTAESTGPDVYRDSAPLLDTDDVEHTNEVEQRLLS